MTDPRLSGIDDDHIPEPAADLDVVVSPEPVEFAIWRLHWESKPLWPKRRNPGAYRFDAPDGTYSVSYGNSSRRGCIAEVYGDIGRIAAGQARRRMTRLTTTRPLDLVLLDSAAVQKQLGLDARIATAKQYRTTQRWGAWLYSHTNAEGIRYVSRHDNAERNYCLFLDRCRSALKSELEGDLRSMRAELLEWADHYSLSVYMPRARATDPG